MECGVPGRNAEAEHNWIQGIQSGIHTHAQSSHHLHFATTLQHQGASAIGTSDIVPEV